MSWPLGWLRSGFSPWIGERRSPIRQGGRILKIVSGLKQRHTTHIQAHLQSASKKSCPKRPNVAFHHALHSQRNKKGAAVIFHLISIRQAHNTQIIYETKWREGEMYRELINHTTSGSKRKSNQGARHAQLPMKIALSAATTLAFAHTPAKACAHGSHACVTHTRGSGRCCVLSEEKNYVPVRAGTLYPVMLPRDTTEPQVCACEK